VEALARALERRREHYNALFAEAQRRSVQLDGGDMLEHLRRRVAPILTALPELSADAEDRVLEALYRASLELLGRGLAGARSQAGSINAVWEVLLPALAHLVAATPRRVVAALSNAAFNLDQTPGARPREWLELLLGASSQLGDVETLLAAGQVAAWRAGLSHYRAGALERCPRLAPDVLSALLGSRGAPLERLASHRFVYPEGDALRLRAVARLGGFSGFGAQFAALPRLGMAGGVLSASDGVASWEIHADAFGALLRRAPAGTLHAPGSTGSFRIAADGRVEHDGLSALFPAIAGAREVAADGDLLAVVLPRSYQLLLIAVTRGEPCPAPAS
jgi:hypothetical protein